jgi:hypothetical protein
VGSGRRVGGDEKIVRGNQKRERGKEERKGRRKGEGKKK